MSRGGIVISRRHLDRTFFFFFFFFYGVVFFCRPFVLSGQAAELSCHTRLPVCLWIMDPHSRGPKKNTHLGNEVLPQDTTHRIQRPCYQRGSPCQDPAGKWTTRRPFDDRKETQSAVVRSCLPFIRSGQSHLARHSKRWKKTRQTEEEAGRQHQGMDRSGVRQVPEGSGEPGKMEETGCKIICGAPTTLAVKGLMRRRRRRKRRRRRRSWAADPFFFWLWQTPLIYLVRFGSKC